MTGECLSWGSCVNKSKQLIDRCDLWKILTSLRYNKTKNFVLRLFDEERIMKWMIKQETAERLLRDYWETAKRLLWRSEPEYWRLIALDKFEPNKQIWCQEVRNMWHGLENLIYWVCSVVCLKFLVCQVKYSRTSQIFLGSYSLYLTLFDIRKKGRCLA